MRVYIWTNSGLVAWLFGESSRKVRAHVKVLREEYVTEGSC